MPKVGIKTSCLPRVIKQKVVGLFMRTCIAFKLKNECLKYVAWLNWVYTAFPLMKTPVLQIPAFVGYLLKPLHNAAYLTCRINVKLHRFGT